MTVQSNYSDLTGANNAINQSEFLVITCNLLKAREKSRVQGAIVFEFASRWLKNWRGSLKPITKRSSRNRVITFDSHLKTALIIYLISGWCYPSFEQLTPVCTQFLTRLGSLSNHHGNGDKNGTNLHI